MNKEKSPQIENGHIDIANEIAEALMTRNFTAYQYRTLWVIWRKTYGWHKKADNIPVSQFVKMSGIKHGHVSRTLKELEVRNVIIRKGSLTSFNKFYTQWCAVPDGVHPYRRTHSGQNRTQRGTKSVPNQGDSKENSKEMNKRKSDFGKSTFSEDDLRMAKLLSDLMTQNNPDRKPTSEKQIEQWANICRLMRTQDNRKIGDIETIMRFSQQDDFWHRNILSMEKFRKQYDQLTLNMKEKINGKRYNTSGAKDNNQFLKRDEIQKGRGLDEHMRKYSSLQSVTRK